MSENEQKPVDIDLSQTSDNPDKPSPETPSAEAALPITTPEGRIALLEAEKAETKDRMLRIAADFENWKKRARKDQTDGEARAKEGVLRDFLEVVDNLERATASFADGKESDAKSVREGVELVLRQFRSKLDRYQVKAVETQKGYTIGDRLLRPAMVVVAAAAPAAKPADAQNDKGDKGDNNAKGES